MSGNRFRSFFHHSPLLSACLLLHEAHITIIWTADNSGVNTPSNTSNQVQPVLPNPVIVDPLPDNTGITATTSPTPDEKHFADYILILPVPDIPPIYIYLSKQPVEFLKVELYSGVRENMKLTICHQGRLLTFI
ncbi:S-type pyocin domain-containing protein [Kosakonia sacchari]|uniref:S-type pyocin domain-containing protein n=1 Tax=Kosakonia sacchari TaxID=1158459 RepID=UPI0020B150F8|nr:S-type pyocin domain-containing protein [Kosakonia sacchari]